MHLNLHYFLVFAVATLAKLLAPPSDGLQSGFNYYIQDSGNILVGIKTIIVLESDLVTSDTGVTFILNAYNSLSGSKSGIVFQQIYFESNPAAGNLIVGIETYNETRRVFVKDAPLVDFSPSTTIPAGTQLEMLLTNDQHGRLTGADFEITIDGDTFTQTIAINQTSASEPITAFMFNVVGSQGNGTFSSGSGVAFYSSQNNMTAVNAQPQGLASLISGFTGNSVYSQMDDGEGNVLAQAFSVG